MRSLVTVGAKMWALAFRISYNASWLNLFSLVQTSSRSLVLDVGEDRLVLTARPSLFHLDIFHPFLINQENSVAQYNNSTQVQYTRKSTCITYTVIPTDYKYRLETDSNTP